jgi:hypothetical protein
MALEPFSSIPGRGLTRAIEAGTAPALAPGASQGLHLAAGITKGTRRITRVSTDANIKFDSA